MGTSPAPDIYDNNNSLKTIVAVMTMCVLLAASKKLEWKVVWQLFSTSVCYS